MEGELLLGAIQISVAPDEFSSQLKNAFEDEEERDKFVEKIPSFTDTYQIWYSEALVLLNQLLPIRVSDFVKLYERPKTSRKNITYENYVIEDALQGLVISTGSSSYKKIIADSKAAIPKFRQQLSILKSVERRFKSSLFDIKQLVQADLFDSELGAAKELAKKGFLRGGGAIAGVVLEKHLSQVCDNHKVKITKKNPSISDYNDKLKGANIYETPTWRKIQHLGDLRNLCDHNKKTAPKPDDVEELISGVEKIVKTLF